MNLLWGFSFTNAIDTATKEVIPVDINNYSEVKLLPMFHADDGLNSFLPACIRESALHQIPSNVISKFAVLSTQKSFGRNFCTPAQSFKPSNMTLLTISRRLSTMYSADNDYKTCRGNKGAGSPHTMLARESIVAIYRPLWVQLYRLCVDVIDSAHHRVIVIQLLH